MSSATPTWPPRRSPPWAQLSSACHAHPYELDPTVVELHRWAGVVRRLTAHIDTGRR
ncbi:MAG TPA: hypothetical protein VFP61_00050 [Acidimicrobiales bacterium]|nr:hypothetical protein [Acidimicrobiales bacterium]